jgi:hypothetical protein
MTRSVLSPTAGAQRSLPGEKAGGGGLFLLPM